MSLCIRGWMGIWFCITNDTEENNLSILDFRERNLIAGEYIDNLNKLMVKVDSIGELNLSSYIMAQV